jgi:hypothetical protein
VLCLKGEKKQTLITFNQWVALMDQRKQKSAAKKEENILSAITIFHAASSVLRVHCVCEVEHVETIIMALRNFDSESQLYEGSKWKAGITFFFISHSKTFRGVNKQIRAVVSIAEEKKTATTCHYRT